MLTGLMTNILELTDAITAQNLNEDIGGNIFEKSVEDVTEIFQAVHRKLGPQGPKRLYTMWDQYTKVTEDFHETCVSLRLYRTFWEEQNDFIHANRFQEPAYTAYKRYFDNLKVFIELDSTITFMSSRLALKKHDYKMTLNRQYNRDAQPPRQDGGADTAVAPWKNPQYSFPKLSPDMTLNAIYDFALQAKI